MSLCWPTHRQERRMWSVRILDQHHRRFRMVAYGVTSIVREAAS